MTDKDSRQAEYFANRLSKNEKHLRRWARRETVDAFRIYDRDIPEIPLSVDFYRSEEGSALSIALYERPYYKEDEEEEAWLALMAGKAAEILDMEIGSVFVRRRKRQRGLDQYERLGTGKAERVIGEGGLRFIVNLSDYLDTGLFLDHRPLRRMVREKAAGKRALNLFSYTGSISVYAAAGGASEVVSVDLSNTYLDWAARNFDLNKIESKRAPMIRADVMSFLDSEIQRGERWDLIVADPPTFSNSKAAREDFDVNRHWPDLVNACIALLNPGGILFFSTNSRKLRWDGSLVPANCEDLSDISIPEDFRDRKAHRLWKIEPYRQTARL